MQKLERKLLVNRAKSRNVYCTILQTMLTFKETSLESELMEREKIILSLFEKGESLPFRKIFKALSTQISKRMLQYNLAELKKKGYFISKGKGRAVVWLRVL